jgi:hypothetical protein
LAADRIVDLRRKNRSVSGLRKIWKAVREDIYIGGDHLGRLMGSKCLDAEDEGASARRSSANKPHAGRSR